MIFKFKFKLYIIYIYFQQIFTMNSKMIRMILATTIQVPKIMNMPQKKRNISPLPAAVRLLIVHVSKLSTFCNTENQKAC